jgi:hypothetical protein
MPVELLNRQSNTTQEDLRNPYPVFQAGAEIVLNPQTQEVTKPTFDSRAETYKQLKLNSRDFGDLESRIRSDSSMNSNQKNQLVEKLQKNQILTKDEKHNNALVSAKNQIKLAASSGGNLGEQYLIGLKNLATNFPGEKLFGSYPDLARQLTELDLKQGKKAPFENPFGNKAFENVKNDLALEIIRFINPTETIDENTDKAKRIINNFKNSEKYSKMVEVNGQEYVDGLLLELLKDSSKMIVEQKQNSIKDKKTAGFNQNKKTESKKPNKAVQEKQSSRWSSFIQAGADILNTRIWGKRK